MSPRSVADVRRLGGVTRERELPLAVERLDDLVLCASELMTNALRHGGGLDTVCVAWTERAIRVEVFDRSPSLSRTAPPTPDAECGRGLVLVAALADRWGWGPRGEGKAVWCELDVPQARRGEHA
ncbi:ATP-binding protein [Streptomyces sp. DSM 44917]|uniref:ATP-binding protein n=1 Tax=Streptomyces boetiae TaxID=3075541 RepID=A0ABU2L852_9ACTN|nr:ATP-binding protein [Streptomyces sp. DSM 44917]MDT0307388.1 ATP-binding protein [Streptomyces sp. DSM 44917]